MCDGKYRDRNQEQIVGYQLNSENLKKVVSCGIIPEAGYRMKSGKENLEDLSFTSFKTTSL